MKDQLLKVLSVVGVFLLVKVVMGSISSLFPVEGLDQKYMFIGFLSFIGSILTLVILYFWNPIKRAPDHWKSISPLLLICLVSMGFLGVALNSFILSFFMDAHESLLEQTKTLLATGLLGLFNVVVLVPIVEEIVFRRILMESMLKVSSPAVAIALSALVFGILHITPVQVLGASCLGLLFGWMYWRVRSILPSLILHILNNGFFMYALSQMEPGSEEKDITSYWSVHHPYGWAVAGITLVVFIALYSLVERLLRCKK